MERLRPYRVNRKAPAHPVPDLVPAPETGALARAAAAHAAAIQPEPAVVRVTVQTTVGRDRGVVQLVATPETRVGEIMDRSCRDLGIDEPARYALVARGELLGERDLPLSSLVGDDLGSDLHVRLVRKPEAGWASC